MFLHNSFVCNQRIYAVIKTLKLLLKKVSGIDPVTGLNMHLQNPINFNQIHFHLKHNFFSLTLNFQFSLQRAIPTQCMYHCTVNVHACAHSTAGGKNKRVNSLDRKTTFISINILIKKVDFKGWAKLEFFSPSQAKILAITSQSIL